MRVRSFVILSLVTVATVAAAAGAVISRDRPETISGAGEKVFPELLERISGLSTIIVRDGERTLTIERTAEGWVLREKDGFPVRGEAVRDAVIQLSRLEKMEGKTRQAESYARLNVEDVDAEGARSKEIALADGDGNVLADLVVGKVATGLGEGGGMYVRRPDEARAWLVSGQVDLGLEPRDWVERRIIDIDPASIRKVVVLHADGETIIVSRPNAEADGFQLETLPDGSRPGDPTMIDSLSTVLSALDLEALAAVDDVAFDSDKTTTAHFETSDGSVIVVELTERDGRTWIRFPAEVVATGPGVSDVATDKNKKFIRDGVPILSRWAYQIPAHKVLPLERPLADFIAPNQPKS